MREPEWEVKLPILIRGRILSIGIGSLTPRKGLMEETRNPRKKFIVGGAFYSRGDRLPMEPFLPGSIPS